MHRMYANEPVFQDEHLWRLYSWLMFYARHQAGAISVKSGTGKRIFRLQPGQVVTGRKALARALNWAESSVKNRLEKLRNLGVISIEVDSQFSIVTVTNYQDDQFIQPVEVDKQRPAKGQSKTKQRTIKDQAKDNQRTQRNNGLNEEKEKTDKREGESCDSVDALSPESNPTSVDQILPFVQELTSSQTSESVIAKAKKLQADLELLEPSIQYYQASEVTEYKNESERKNDMHRAVQYADVLEAKHQTRCSPFNIETEEQFIKVKAQRDELQSQLRSLSDQEKKRQANYKSTYGLIAESQFVTIAQTFFNYWTGQNWKRKGKPVDWRHELDTWVWREIEKLQKTSNQNFHSERKPDPYANAKHY